MKTIYKKLISMLVCFSLLFVFTVSGYAASNENINYSKLPSNAQILENTDKITKIMVESENGKCIATLDKQTKEIIVETTDDIMGNKTYTATIDKYENTKVSATLKDKETGETYKLGETNNHRKKRFAWMLVLVPEVVAALEALAATTLTFAAAGVTWYTGTKIEEHINDKKDHYDYFAAALKNKMLCVGAPLTKRQAVAAVRSGADIFAKNKTAAQLVVLTCGGPARDAEIHGTKKQPAYYWHYHCNAHPDVHIFYLK
ncbi:hypothetical protein IZY60_13815 [Lutibacter sp. B2]|nr:hypothetical protein [Lutibacter sp. B2]